MDARAGEDMAGGFFFRNGKRTRWEPMNSRACFSIPQKSSFDKAVDRIKYIAKWEVKREWFEFVHPEPSSVMVNQLVLESCW
jgi:hypothetical protein